MRALVVGLVNRPHRKPLADALARRGHSLDACFSTDLVIEAAPGRFDIRLIDKPLEGYDLILLWAVKHRRWEWYLAGERLLTTGATAVVSHRPFVRDQPPSISVAWDLHRLQQAGLQVARTLVFADEGAGPRLFRELRPPLVLRGMCADFPSPGRVVRDADELDAALKDREERAFLLSELVIASVAFRFMVLGGAVAGTIKLPHQPHHGVSRPEDEGASVRIFQDHDRLTEAALRAAAALGADAVEVDLCIDHATGAACVLNVNRSLDSFAFDDHGVAVWDALAAFLESAAGSVPKPRPSALAVDARATAARLDPATRAPRSLTAVVLHQDVGVDPRPALKLGREVANYVVLGTGSPDAALASDADRCIPLAPGIDPTAAWASLLRECPGTHVLWLDTADRLDAVSASRLATAFGDLPVDCDGIAAPVSLARDGFGHDRHRVTVARILPLREDIALDATGLLPRPRAQLKLSIHKEIQFRRAGGDGPAERALEGAATRLKAALASGADARAELGEVLLRLKRYAEAAEVLTPAIERVGPGPERARLLTFLALAWLRLEDVGRCRTFARSALAEDPRLREPRHLLGESYYAVGEHSRARRWLQEAHATPLPADGDVLYPYWYTWFTLDMLSCACDRLGDFDAALAYLEEVERILPSTERLRRNRARLEARRASERIASVTDAPAIPGRRLSVCIIVRDEGPAFSRCLENLHLLSDEIIVVDTGSVDETMEIARRYTDRVSSFPWIDDFSAARNHSLDLATGTHVLWLDSDDRISPEDASTLRRLVDTLPEEVDVVRIPYVYSWDEAGQPRFIQHRERILRNDKGLRFKYPIHELIPLEGRRVVSFEGARIEHDSRERPGESRLDRNRRILEATLARPEWADDRHLRFHLAQAYTSLGLLARAQDLLVALVETSTTDRQRGRMGFRAARCCLELGELGAARDHAERARAALPGIREPVVVLGELAALEGDLPAARRWYEEALRIPRGRDAIHEHWYRWEVERRLAEVLLAQGDLEGARAMIDVVADALPGSQTAADLETAYLQARPKSA